MAELNTGNSDTGKHQKQRAKRMSTKMDMTPMVDLLLDDTGKIYWYNGELKPETKLEETSCSKQGLRKLLLEKNSGNFTVVVKPSAKTNYERVIDVLDELKIANIERYALVDPQQQELALLSGN